MKILVVTDLYPPHFVGGYELKCKLHADELIQRGHQVSVLTSTWKTNKEDVPEDNVSRLLLTTRNGRSTQVQNKLPGVFTFYKRFNQLTRLVTSRKNYKIARQLISISKPDLVYAWQLDDVSIGPILAAQDQGIPIVFRLDDYWLANLKREICLDANPLKRRYRAMINGLQDFNTIDFGHMLVVSRFVKKSYVEAGFLSQDIMVMPEGVLSEIILDDKDLPTPAARDPFRLVYVGRLVHQKGTHVALEALAHLVREKGMSNIHLDIIGLGPNEYLNQLKSMAQELEIASHVEFVGFVEHKQVLARFLKYNAVLIPSLWEEPLSGTIAEAMARGLPVIATDRGGNPEIIFDSENGLLVPPGDSVKLAYAIKKLIDNPAMLQKLRYNALNTVRENYMHEKIVDRVEEYFEGILSSI